MLAHAQKPYFVFRLNGRVHLNRPVEASVQSTAGSRVVRISGSNAGYTMFRGSVKATGYPLHSPVSLSLPLPCVTVCHHVSTGLYIAVSCGDLLTEVRQAVGLALSTFYLGCRHVSTRNRCVSQECPTDGPELDSLMASRGCQTI